MKFAALLIASVATAASAKSLRAAATYEKDCK
jgi:hypothetical protein